MWDADLAPRLLEDLEKARRRIRVAMYLFRIGGRRPGSSDAVFRCLAQAAARGVSTEVLLERGQGGDEHGSLDEDNLAAARRLRRAGVRVYLTAPVLTPRGRVISVPRASPPRHRTLHAKMIRIDGDLAYVGSHNLTPAALRWNHEVTLRVRSRRLARGLDEYLDRVVAEEGFPLGAEPEEKP